MSSLNRLGLGTMLIAMLIIMLGSVEFGTAEIAIWALAIIGLLLLSAGRRKRE